MRASTNRYLDQYQFTVRPLSKDEGGGYLVEYPDRPGCMSDGETIEEAIENGREALPRLHRRLQSVESKATEAKYRGCAMAPEAAADTLFQANETGGERGRQY